MQHQRSAAGVADHLRLAAHPNDVASLRVKPILRAKVRSIRTGLREFHVPAIPIVGVQPAVPQHRAAKPFGLREPEQPFDLGTDVHLARGPVAALERRHERDRGHLLDDGAIATSARSKSACCRTRVEMSRTTHTTHTCRPVGKGLRFTSTGNSVPSWRRPNNFKPSPIERFTGAVKYLLRLAACSPRRRSGNKISTGRPTSSAG